MDFEHVRLRCEVYFRAYHAKLLFRSCSLLPVLRECWDAERVDTFAAITLFPPEKLISC